MNITDELEKLDKLHKDGVLNEEEFSKAKDKLLNQNETSYTQEIGSELEDNSLGEAANRYVTFRIVMAVIGFILFLIFLFGFFLPHMPSNNGPFGN